MPVRLCRAALPRLAMASRAQRKRTPKRRRKDPAISSAATNAPAMPAAPARSRIAAREDAHSESRAASCDTRRNASCDNSPDSSRGDASVSSSGNSGENALDSLRNGARTASLALPGTLREAGGLGCLALWLLILPRTLLTNSAGAYSHAALLAVAFVAAMGACAVLSACLGQRGRRGKAARAANANQDTASATTVGVENRGTILIAAAGAVLSAACGLTSLFVMNPETRVALACAQLAAGAPLVLVWARPLAQLAKRSERDMLATACLAFGGAAAAHVLFDVVGILTGATANLLEWTGILLALLSLLPVASWLSGRSLFAEPAESRVTNDPEASASSATGVSPAAEANSTSASNTSATAISTPTSGIPSAAISNSDSPSSASAISNPASPLPASVPDAGAAASEQRVQPTALLATAAFTSLVISLFDGFTFTAHQFDLVHAAFLEHALLLASMALALLLALHEPEDARSAAAENNVLNLLGIPSFFLVIAGMVALNAGMPLSAAVSHGILQAAADCLLALSMAALASCAPAPCEPRPPHAHHEGQRSARLANPASSARRKSPASLTIASSATSTQQHQRELCPAKPARATSASRRPNKPACRSEHGGAWAF